MMKMSARYKKYSVLEQFTTAWLLVGISGMFALMCGLAIWAAGCFLSQPDDMDWLALAAMMGVLPIGWLCIFLKDGALKRLTLRFQFSPDGIHCSGLMWGHFTVPWESIHTYGTFNGTPCGVYAFSFLFFSQDPNEYVMKKMNTLRKDRLVLQFYPQIWDAVREYMPADMKKHLEDAVCHNYQGFFKR